MPNDDFDMREGIEEAAIEEAQIVKANLLI